MPEMRVETERCKGCGLCAHVCPRKIILFDEALNKKGYHPACVLEMEKCIGCAMCALICPDCAITVENDANQDG